VNIEFLCPDCFTALSNFTEVNRHLPYETAVVAAAGSALEAVAAIGLVANN